MKKFEFLDHTADAKFLAYGKSMEEAFGNAALALTSLMTDIKKIKPQKKIHIQIQALRLEPLLFDFLDEFIYLMDTQGFLLHKVESLKIKDLDDQHHLDAVVLGDSGDYELLTQIKSMTYSDMFIKEEKDLVTIQVVLDI